MAPHRGRRGWERRVDAEVAQATAGRAADREARDAATGIADRTEGHGAGRRLPDLSGLPPLLAASGAFEALRDRMRSIAAVGAPTGATGTAAAAARSEERRVGKECRL